MLERDEKKSGEEGSGNTDACKILTGGWFAALRERLVGTGADAGLRGRRPILLTAVLAASCAWFLSGGAEPEAEMFVAPPRAAAPQASLHEEAAGAKEAGEGKSLADPFSLLHSNEQATLAAVVAVGGGDERSAAALNRTAAKDGEPRTGNRRDDKGSASPSGIAGKSDAAAVPQVRGTVTSNVGTVLLLSVGGHDFFLAEGEEKEGVLLQSLSDKSAVVVIGDKSYTLSLPG